MQDIHNTNSNDLNIENVYVIEPIYNESLNVQTLINEISSLIYSAGGKYVGAKIVKVREITPATYIGKGKILEIKEDIAKYEVNSILFDGALSPSQTINLSNLFGVKVIDRTQLILDIFALNAKTYEGKLQVTLAQLNYLYPRLKGKGQELSRLGGGIGTRGPGETQLESDRRYIRNAINGLKKELKQLETRRNLHQNRRNKQNEILVSLIGYTNSGKSTLLNLLTNSNVLSENKLFATLDTTVRKCKINNYDVLLSDTVGFIRNIPTDLIEAFKSTLKTAVDSDLCVIVLDGTSDTEMQLDVTTKTLSELNCNTPIIKVVNKCDKISDFTKFYNDEILISAKTGYNIDALKNAISNAISAQFITTNFKLNYNDINEFIKLTKFASNYNLTYNDDYVYAQLTVKKIHFDKFLKFKR